MDEMVEDLSDNAKASFNTLNKDFALIAYSPVVRGKQYGPSSYEATQVKAKDLARDMLDGIVAPSAWEDHLTDSTSVEGLLERLDEQEVCFIICPQCKQPI